MLKGLSPYLLIHDWKISPDNKVKWAFLKFTLGTRQRTLGLVAG